ncbi:MAG TPA: threonine synthase [Chloroflexota bacterium]|nr:threonine synthase [Chloroflexota bacterium]
MVEHPFVGRCPACRGIVECQYDDASLAAALHRPGAGPGLNRWVGALPVTSALPTLGEGDTPLLAAPRLGAELGMSQLWLKNEGRSATGAFKDRGAVVALALAREVGARGTLTASSGNAASAVAAYSAAAGLDCLVLVGPGSAPNKLQQVLAYGAQILVVRDLFRTQEGLLGLLEGVSRRLDRLLVFFWALSNPYTIEGMKTLAYELYLQTGGRLPDAVVVPTGGGDLYTGIWRGFCDLRRVGLIDRVPRMLAAQAQGAAPLARAVAAGAERVAQLEDVGTVASGIRVAFTGDHALRALRESGGAVVSVTDHEILSMQRRVAIRAGIWVEPTAAVSVAAIPHFLAQGALRPEERVICVLTGAGYKDVSPSATAEVEALLATAPLPLDAAVVADHALPASQRV